MPASYVKAYVKRGKNDAADAAAICEAVTRPSMRFVPVKTAEQQWPIDAAPDAGSAGPPAHAVDQRHARTPGRARMVAAQGRDGLKKLIAIVADARAASDPAASLRAVQRSSRPASSRSARSSDIMRSIASATQSAAGDHTRHRCDRCDRDRRHGHRSEVFKSGREFAAWIGLVPRQTSSGGKERLGSISKQGDRYLRRLLIVGATAVIRQRAPIPTSIPGSCSCWRGDRPRLLP